MPHLKIMKLLEDKIEKLKERKLSRLYFIHIPKTAGTFVRQSFDGHRMIAHANHASFHKPASLSPGYIDVNCELDGASNKAPDDCLVIATIRNPFDMLVSMYTYGSYGFTTSPPSTVCTSRAPLHHNDYPGVPGGRERFTYIIKEYCEGIRGRPDLRHMLFHQIFDDEGICKADILIRTEFLEKGLVEIGKLLSPPLKPTLPEKRINPSLRINRSSHHYKPYYDNDLRKLVEKKCAIELEEFGYTFDGPVNDSPFVILNKEFRFKIGDLSTNEINSEQI